MLPHTLVQHLVIPHALVGQQLKWAMFSCSFVSRRWRDALKTISTWKWWIEERLRVIAASIQPMQLRELFAELWVMAPACVSLKALLLMGSEPPARLAVKKEKVKWIRSIRMGSIYEGRLHSDGEWKGHFQVLKEEGDRIMHYCGKRTSDGYSGAMCQFSLHKGGLQRTWIHYKGAMSGGFISGKGVLSGPTWSLSCTSWKSDADEYGSVASLTILEGESLLVRVLGEIFIEDRDIHELQCMATGEVLGTLDMNMLSLQLCSAGALSHKRTKTQA